MKFKITVPQKKGDKWFLGYGARPRGMARADTLYNRLERLLLRTKLKEKTSIVVKYGKDTSNETVASFDVKYLLYATSCFLEDYLSKVVLKRVEKKYFVP